MRDFRNLLVWQRSHELTLEAYRVTKGYPKEELYSLTTQTRRASYSIPTNIAEGCGKSTEADFARFLDIAMGSACELEYEMILARDLEYLPSREYDPIQSMIVEVKRMLAALVQRVRPQS